jgi:hypothetical protein
MTNSAAQGYVADVINGPPKAASPLAAYSGPDRELTQRNPEAQTLGTQASDEGTQLPHP